MAKASHWALRRGGLVLGIVLAVVAADQCIKFAVKTHLALREARQVFSWFYIYFVENKGIAFGFDAMGTLPIAIFRLLFIGVLIYYVARVARRKFPVGFLVCLSLVLAGAVGNIIDNLFYGLVFSESTPYSVAHVVPWGWGYGSFLSGRVVDMFYFPLFSFTWPDFLPLLGGRHFEFFNAVFNFADSAITCGGIAIVLFYRQSLARSLGHHE